MYRLSAVLTAIGLSLSVLFGLALTAEAGPRAPAPARAAAPRAEGIDLHMSTERDGPRQRGFLSNTTSAYAVLSYQNAVNERFQVRLRDLSGVLVKDERVGPVSGSGTRSVQIQVTDFVNAYRTGINSQASVLGEKLDEAVESCRPENIPPVPDWWPTPPPPPTPRPGEPTATPSRPDPYLIWVQATLESVEIARTATAGVTRTLQSVLTLPDVIALPAAHDSFQAAQRDFVAADAALKDVPGLLRPVSEPERPGQPTPPPPPKPNPQAGCDKVRAAKASSDKAIGENAAGWAAVPADTSGWRFPATSARYGSAGRDFLGCVQYNTDVYGYVGDRPQDTATKSAFWTVGDPGPAALVFPAADQADRSNLGTIDVTLPPDQVAIYAGSVTVPGVNHQAFLSAFVTDAMCNPVDGVRLGFTVSPPGAGTVTPTDAAVVQGVPQGQITFNAGAEAVNNGLIAATVPGGATPATGQGTFQVVGPAGRLQIIVNPRTINLLDPKADRGGISVVVRDQNGRDVANGTAVRVRIGDTDPGILAYDQLLRVSGQVEKRRVVLGKQADLVTLDGYSQVPASDDPAVTNQGLYLTSEGAVGKLTLSAEADGKTANTNNPSTGEKTLEIVRRLYIQLPFLLKNFDVRNLRPPTIAQ